MTPPTDTLSRWEAETRQRIEAYKDSVVDESTNSVTVLNLQSFREPYIRILALIDLVRKKDEAMIALREDILSHKVDKNTLVQYEKALALTEELK